MALNDPVAAYVAQSNPEAHFLCEVLIEAGIQAVVVENMSELGVPSGGIIPGLYRPQVWIERKDVDRAKPVLDNCERLAAQRWTADANTGAATIEVTCEECGQRNAFYAMLKGTVQTCPHCDEYVDVSDEPEFGGWDGARDE